MKVCIINLILALSLLNSGNCQDQNGIKPEQKQKLEQLKHEVIENLTVNILPYWSAKMVDNVNGGFYGRIDGNEKVYTDSDKGGILNARILWTFSSAYRIMKDESYMAIAIRAKDYILKNFIDPEYGGAYMSLKADGTPADTRKHVYTNAFFIYALAEYNRATGDSEALAAAKKIFELFEKYASDKEYGGYFEVFNREWERTRDRIIGESSDRDEKTMNTSLHVMEAYANLYRVTSDEEVGDRLREMIDIFLNKIIDESSSHLICFMDRQWNGTSRIDSYGHDIESSWLLYEAADLLGDVELKEKVKHASLKIADAAAEGHQTDGGMITEKDHSTGQVRARRSWWEQSETVVGYLNAFELTGNNSYLERSLKTWDYIKRYFVDTKNGGWFSSVSEKGIPGGDKAGFWICPYHNSRMCLEVTERLSDL